MILCEEHSIRRSACRELYDRIDDFCYRSKNLHNLANYLITQCSRISRKLKDGGILEEWESELIRNINTAIGAYNDSRPGKKKMQSISEQNGFLSDAYFLRCRTSPRRVTADCLSTLVSATVSIQAS